MEILFQKENISDFSVNPIEVAVDETTVVNENVYYFDLRGTLIPQGFKDLFPQQTAMVSYVYFELELSGPGGSLKLPYNAVINQYKKLVSRPITVIKDADNFTFNNVSIHFPKGIEKAIESPTLSVYIGELEAVKAEK